MNENEIEEGNTIAKRIRTAQLKGHTYSVEEYRYKKAHPIKWKIKRFLKRLLNTKN